MRRCWWSVPRGVGTNAHLALLATLAEPLGHTACTSPAS
jgi:hypothetical protein